MKRLKKSVATVLAFVMVWSLMSLQSFGATITKSTTWDFTKWTAQTLTNDYSYDNLTVTATSTKKVRHSRSARRSGRNPCQTSSPSSRPRVPSSSARPG